MSWLGIRARPVLDIRGPTLADRGRTFAYRFYKGCDRYL